MAIDPRIRARRVQVHRAEGRRRLRFLAVALGLVAVAVGAWGLTRTPLLDLDHVRVDGAEGADAEVVLDRAALVTGTAMFDLDLGAAEAAVAELAWIKSVRAQREWPGSVRLTVVARTGVAVLADATSAFIVDEDSVVIGPAGPESDLPVVRWTTVAAPGEAEREALPAIAVARAIPDDLHPWVEAVTVDEGGLGLDLIGSATVRLGDGGLMEDKLSAVRSVLQNVELDCLDFIDVTAADLTTALRDEVCNADNGGEPTDDTP
ncbi:MAG: FtsQ-type POTRA domain-containing protein [Acidimicrobiales bacterium]|nr:FtsQ-type POTRA domain-containing protein [Acidimicrobiales bacterium]